MAGIPDGMLPVPRLIVFYDNSASDRRPLDVLHRTYFEKATDDGAPVQGVTAGGDHWAGWHLPDPEAVAGLARVARNVAPKHWTILEEQPTL